MSDVQPDETRRHELIAGKYRVERLLGRGGGASVYLATHLAMSRPVAIKLLHQSMQQERSVLERFEREAKLISQLKHPNTITVFDYGEHGEELYLVMEYVEGPSLQELVAQQGALTPERAVQLTLGILSSLEEAHHYGILHRDLKPANIMVTRDFKGAELPKVVDFGIAKLLHANQDASLTQENAFVGTPRYSAPEQIMSQELTPAADLYGVGMILWQLLLGEPAIRSNAVKDCLRAHLSRQAWVMPAHAGVSSSLAKIVETALIKDPEWRYGSCAQMIDDLRAWLADPHERPEGTLRLERHEVERMALEGESALASDEPAMPTLQLARAPELPWTAPTNQMIDPNVGRTDELIEMLTSARDSPLHDSMTGEPSPEVQTRPVAPTARSWDMPARAELDSPKVPLETLAQTLHQTSAGQTQATQAPASDARSPHKAPRSDAARLKLASLAMAVFIALGLLAVGWRALLRSGADQPAEDTQGAAQAASSKTSASAQAPDHQTSAGAPKKTTSSFSEEGLKRVLLSAGWRMDHQGQLIDLGHLRQRAMTLKKGKAQLEVTYYEINNEQTVAALLKELAADESLERFEDKLLRLRARSRASQHEVEATQRLLTRYRAMVLERAQPQDQGDEPR